jgi:hypothetical protein
MTRTLKQAGYDKIASVEVERFSPEEGDGFGYAHIIGKTVAGDVFTVSFEHGEDEDALCAAIAARGYTTDRCVFRAKYGTPIPAATVVGAMPFND